jgi:hypothetical protein
VSDVHASALSKSESRLLLGRRETTSRLNVPAPLNNLVCPGARQELTPGRGFQHEQKLVDREIRRSLPFPCDCKP